MADGTTSQEGLPARAAALRLLSDVLGSRRLLSEALPAATADLPPPDRARAQRLATATLRGIVQADRLLSRHLSRTPPLAVRNLLRLGCVELAGGAAAHGVVNDLVTLARRGKRTASMSGLVNAVLRKVAAGMPADWDATRPSRLPSWLRGPLVEAWGRERIARMELVHAAPAPIDLTARGDAAALAEQLGGALLPTGSVRLTDPGQISALPGYDAGDFWVQDAAAALPARLLAARTGERIADICAAPGGKTLQLSAAGAEVTALDVSSGRLDRLRENLARTGLKANVVVSDAFDFDERGFDAVLLDAPCSATGTIRRHPDLPHAKDGAEFAGLIALQSRLIDHALTLLKPGGRLMLCTCSVLPDEGEVQVEQALQRHPGLAVLPLAPPPGCPDWTSPEGGLRILPDDWAGQGGIDGFYMALLSPGTAA